MRGEGRGTSPYLKAGACNQLTGLDFPLTPRPPPPAPFLSNLGAELLPHT